MKKIKRRESESEIWVSGQFVSDEDMDELGLTAKRKKAVHEECARMKGWIRRNFRLHVVLWYGRVKREKERER